MNRLQKLLPNNIPKYIRCYNNPNYGDRFTVVFTGNYKGREGCDYLSMSENPFHPQGIGQHGSATSIIDKPKYSHLGKKIQFNQLSPNAQKLVLRDYKELWNLNEITQ